MLSAILVQMIQEWSKSLVLWMMSDVVEFARNIDWFDDTGAKRSLLQRAYATSGAVLGCYQPSDISRKREGASLSDMMTSGPRARVSLIIRVNSAEDLFEDSETVAMATTSCSLNDGTVADAVARASQIGQN